MTRRRGILAFAPVLVLAACSAADPAPPGGSAPKPTPAASSSAPRTSPSRADPSPSPSRPAALLGASDIAAFEDRFGPGASVAVVALDDSAPVTSQVTGTPYAWSTIKVVIVAQTLLDAGGPSGLTGAQRDLIRRALSVSDNEAAAALHEQIMARHGGLQGAADTMERMLRESGDEVTEISTQARSTFSTYGQTRWRPGEQSLFLAALTRGCLLDPASTDYVLAEMGTVDADQRWGVGLVGSPAFKGGWGPDPDGRFLVRQFGLVRAADGNEFAAAILVRPGDASFETGKADLGRMASWLGRRVGTAPAPTACR